MVLIAEVRAQNATLKSLPANLVAVFVGGTSGIGFFTAREFVRSTTSPHVYLIGRNATEAGKIIEELKSINSASQVSFIQKDISLLKNVDEACNEIKSNEKQVNILFMTCGYLTMKGRDETAEGLDRKLTVQYYARMRFIQNLTPLLNASSKANMLSRVVAVLDPQAGLRLGGLNFSDLSLKHNFSLKNVLLHGSAMTSLSISNLAKQNPKTSYIHAYPSGVETGATRELFGRFNSAVMLVLGGLFRRLLFVPQLESGERHLFAATAPRYASKVDGQTTEVVGSDGTKGSGSYLLSWDGEVFPDTKKAQKLREDSGEAKVWQHTEEVFKKIQEEGKY
jgi:NAD(P)-dependent dehydrogenase (short-subunit alcohol dehydrogenase family)